MFDTQAPAKLFLADIMDVISAKIKAGETPELELEIFGGVFVVSYNEAETIKRAKQREQEAAHVI
jgi:hypothetical protein